MNTYVKQDIEFFRIICAFGIVWYHVGASGHDISYSALLIFIMLSCYLTKATKISIGFLKKMSLRILLPWIIWFTIYSIVNVISHKPYINIENGFFAAILSGSSIHLWYLPFIFIVCITTSQIKQYFSHHAIYIFTAVTSILILLLTFLWRPYSISLGYPYAQYFHATAGVLIGVNFSYYHTVSKRTSTITLLCLIIASLFALSYSGVGTPYIIAIVSFYLLCENCFSFLNKIDLTPISYYTLGVYLVHPLLIRIFKKLNIDSPPILAIFAFVASILTIKLMRNKFKLSKMFT